MSRAPEHAGADQLGDPGRWSMASRLTRQLTLGLVLLWLLAVASAGTVVKFEMNEVFDSVLAETAQHLLSDILDRQRPQLEAMRPGDPPLVPETPPHDEYITWQLLAADGRLLARSHHAPEAPPPAPPTPGFHDTASAHLYVEASLDGAYRFVIAEPGPHRHEAIRGTLIQLLLPMALLILGTLLLVPVAVRRAMRPLRSLQGTLATRGGANLAEIGAIGLPEELNPIRQAVNLLLRRLRQALDAERSFTMNAAHELRTPVAAALAQAQLLARHLAADRDAQRRAESIAAELRRLGRRVEKLLQLGRAEAGVALRLAPTDLLVPLQLLIAERPDRDRITFDGSGLEELLVRADVDMLAIALRNLIENALLHGDPAEPVRVRVTAEGEVSVANAGPVVPADRLAALCGRFVRHGSANGSGLGLAIVRAVAEQGGASLALHSPARGHPDGFEAVLRLPLAGAAAAKPTPAPALSDA